MEPTRRFLDMIILGFSGPGLGLLGWLKRNQAHVIGRADLVGL